MKRKALWAAILPPGAAEWLAFRAIERLSRLDSAIRQTEDLMDGTALNEITNIYYAHLTRRLDSLIVKRARTMEWLEDLSYVEDKTNE